MAFLQILNGASCISVLSSLDNLSSTECVGSCDKTAAPQSGPAGGPFVAPDPIQNHEALGCAALSAEEFVPASCASHGVRDALRQEPGDRPDPREVLPCSTCSHHYRVRGGAVETPRGAQQASTLMRKNTYFYLSNYFYFKISAFLFGSDMIFHLCCF